MTKQAKIANQIKRNIRRIADAKPMTIINTREWQEYAGAIYDARWKLYKEYKDILKQFDSHIKESAPEVKRKIQSIVHDFINKAHDVKLDYNSDAWNKYYLNDAKRKFKYQENSDALGQLANQIKNNPLKAVDNSYSIALKQAKDFLRKLK